MKKQGISLIVLVITIIIMIILAGAVILSLSSSDVTGQANWSTIASDRANYQAEYATIYATYMAENYDVDATGTGIYAKTGDAYNYAPYSAWHAKVLAAGFTVSEAATGVEVKREISPKEAVTYGRVDTEAEWTAATAENIVSWATYVANAT